MTARGLLLLLLVAIFVASEPARAVDLKARSVSSSGQFVIFCEDVTLRGRVTGFVEEVKGDVLNLLGEGNHWRMPIVITLEKAPTPKANGVTVRLFETPEGMTVQINARIGDDPAAIHLQKQVIRALLLEFEYRDKPPVKAGEHYAEPPWWLVQGMIQMIRRRDLGVDSDFFQGLLKTNRLPPIDDFLKMDAEDLGAAAEAIDGACAMCLLQLLIEQPNGKANLVRLLRNWPERSADPTTALMKDFPGLGDSAASLQKWWTLNIARFAAVERYKGLSIAETDAELAQLLHFEVADKTGAKRPFDVRQFDEVLRFPTGKATFAKAHADVLALATRANALLQPVVSDYEQILAALARGKTRGIAARINAVEGYRDSLKKRVEAITDYMNWYEATQLGVSSGAFDSFLKTANKLSAEEAKQPKVSDEISRYLDELEKEF